MEGEGHHEHSQLLFSLALWGEGSSLHPPSIPKLFDQEGAPYLTMALDYEAHRTMSGSA